MASAKHDTCDSDSSNYDNEDVDLALNVSFEELRLNRRSKNNTPKVIVIDINAHNTFSNYPPLRLKSWNYFCQQSSLEHTSKNPILWHINSSHKTFPHLHVRQFQHTNEFATNDHRIHQPILINNRKERRESYFDRIKTEYLNNPINQPTIPFPMTNNNIAALEQQYTNSISLETQRTKQLLQMLPTWVKGCNSDNVVQHFNCTQRIRKLLSLERNPPIKIVIDSGVVPRLIEFLEYDKMEQLQFESAWCITNIASGAAENTQYIIDNGAVPIFINLLKSKSIEIQEQSAWGLGNIAGDSVECRDIVLQQNILLNLIPIFSIQRIDSTLALRRTITWTLSNLCRGRPSLQIVYAKQIIEVFNKLLLEKNQDEEILQDTIWGYTYLFADEYRNIIIGNEAGQKIKTELLVSGYLREIREKELDYMIIPNDILMMLIIFAPIADIYICSDILKQMIELLGHDNVHIRHPSVRAIHDILGSKTENNNTKQLCINYGMLNKLKNILIGNRTSIKKEVCSLINNLVIESPIKIIYNVINEGIIDALMKILSGDKALAKESLFAIGNTLRNGNDKQVEMLVSKGVIEKIGIMKEPVLALMQCVERIIDVYNGKFIDRVKACGKVFDLVNTASFKHGTDGYQLRLKLMSVLYE
eukprot:421334_1